MSHTLLITQSGQPVTRTARDIRLYLSVSSDLKFYPERSALLRKGHSLWLLRQSVMLAKISSAFSMS